MTLLTDLTIFKIISTCLKIHTHSNTLMCIYVLTHVATYMLVGMHMCTQTHRCTHAHTHACLCTYIQNNYPFMRKPGFKMH
jgi:hypothetical protein